MNTHKSSRKALKICCATTAIFLLIIFIVLITLFLTILKPKEPQISAYPVGLQNLTLSLFANATQNVTLRFLITVQNPNYGSFEYKNATAYVNYYDEVVAEVPIQHERVPAHGKINISTYGELMANKLTSSPYFLKDVGIGRLNFTSTARLPGKVRMLEILKLGATTYTDCDISIFIFSQNVESNCKSRIKL